jgi:hypothetical protein
MGSRHEAGSRHAAARIDRTLMSYAEAQKAAQLAAFYKGLNAQQQARYLTELTFFKEIAFITAVANANSVNAIPAAWMPTAICEESGRDDPNYGYFGIKEWDGFDGYPSAGSAPLSVQLAWETRYIGAPPDAPGRCHGY